MVKQIRVLSEKDMDLLQELLDERRRTKKGPPASPPPSGPPKASQVLIAYPQTSIGIPALSATAPGYADSDIYWIDESPATPTLTKITGLEYRVYNLLTEALGQVYLPIYQDRTGRWLTGMASLSGIGLVVLAPTQTFATTDAAFSANLDEVYGDAPDGTGTGDVTINNTGGIFSGDTTSVGIALYLGGTVDAYFCIMIDCPGTGT